MRIAGATEWLRETMVAPWTRDHVLGLRMIVACSIVTIMVAFAGPSAVALNLGPRRSLLPPWYLPNGVVNLSEWVSVPLLWVMLFVGAAGMWICWNAISDGWEPNIHRLFGLGAVLTTATALVPPLTSADVLMYAAYGRLQVIGRDPYEITPAEIFREQFDPVLRWTERPWQDTPSVYGPIASWSQRLAATLGGENMHDIVFWLQMLAVIPFLVIAFIAVKMAHGNLEVQSRALLFTILNPIMIWSIVAGAHNEALTLVFAIVGLWYYRKNPWLAGVGIGLAGCVKVSLVFYGIAMAWGFRHDLRKLMKLCIGAALPIAILYGFFAPEALLAASRNTGYVSIGSWAEPFYGFFRLFLSDHIARQICSAAGWVMMFVTGWMLSRALPWSLVPGTDPDTDPRHDPLTIAVRTAITISTAWLISMPYTLSWYDILTWVPLGLMAACRLDWLMIVRGVWLSVGYVTGRAIEFSAAMLSTAFVIRDIGCVAAQWFVLYRIYQWWRESGAERPSRRFIYRGLRSLGRSPTTLGLS